MSTPSGNASSGLSNTLADAMNFVRSIEETKSIQALTLDALLKQQIAALQSSGTTAIVDPEGNTVYNRPSRYDQLSALQASINAAVKAIQAAGTDSAKLAALGLSVSPQKNQST